MTQQSFEKCATIAPNTSGEAGNRVQTTWFPDDLVQSLGFADVRRYMLQMLSTFSEVEPVS